MARASAGSPGEGADPSARSLSWVRGELQSGLPRTPAELLELLFGVDAPALRRMPGRETLAWSAPEPVSACILKRTRGGEARDYWYERLVLRSARSPAQREAENLLALERAGLPVPRALAWVADAAARGHPGREGRSALLLERVPFEESLRERLASCDPDERRRRLDELCALVCELHAAGWIHRDLYLQHLVVTGDPERTLVLLDLGRARHASRHGARWWVKDLAALACSAPAAVTRAERWRFLRRWLEARGESSRAERRRLAKRVLRKARRLAAHRPRHLDPEDPVDRELLERTGVPKVRG